MGDDVKKGAIPGKVPDLLKLNREIAYRGRVGRLRERYCIEQLRYMKACHQQIARDQIAYVEARGETLSCRKGCSFCCYFYVEASLQECEAIVYYLYHNESALNGFLERYFPWREALEQNGDLFEGCEQIFTEMLLSGVSKQGEQAFEEALRLYRKQNIGCPFLVKDLCQIYEVRPATCAGLSVTTSPDRCNPQNFDDPKCNLTVVDGAMFDLSFYYRRLSRPSLLFMPVAVYGILEGSFSYLSRFPGLRNLAAEALSDPEVKEIT